MRRLRSLTARMVLSHILVATLTSVIAVLIVVLLLTRTTQSITTDYYELYARLMVSEWQFGDPDGAPNAPELPHGFGVVVSSQDVILQSYGDTACRAHARLAECAPSLVDRPTGAHFFMVDGQRWAEIVRPTVTGQRVIIQYGPPSSEPTLVVGETVIRGTWPFLLTVSGTMLLIAAPLALGLAWVWVRPITRRVSRIAQLSHRFAGGAFGVRVHDRGQDEVGDLARQFDDMADSLTSNIDLLRDLAERNAALAQQAEQSAIQAERLRLSRDLHDDVAQQLFGLSVSAATLPVVIERDQQAGLQQARAIAAHAEQTLLSLRTLLVQLRPSAVLTSDFPQALQALCVNWQVTHHIPVQCVIVLTGTYLPTAVEDVLYRVAQEALHNVARHAHAASVAVSVVEGQRQITLSITDDGNGFDPSGIAGPGRFGLISMRERAQAVGGSMAIESDTSRGTTLRLTLPLAREVME